MTAGTLILPCALGPGGIRARKREGDGVTPRGRFPVLSGFFRPDHGARPHAQVPMRALRRTDAWCDDPADARYNRAAVLPLDCSHERMWRNDGLYDLGLVIDYNVRHPRKRLGSAIFVHMGAPDLRPTAGCVALRAADLRRLLPRLRSGCLVVIG